MCYVFPFDKAGRPVDGKEHIPVDGTQIDRAVTYKGKTGQVSWKQVTDERSDGFVNFEQCFGGTDSQELIEVTGMRLMTRELKTMLAYAWVSVNSPGERQVQIRITTRNNTEIWLNGKSVLTINQDRRSSNVLYHTISVTLKSGANSILVKSSEHEWSNGVTLWLTDLNGNPLEDLTFPKSNR